MLSASTKISTRRTMSSDILLNNHTSKLRIRRIYDRWHLKRKYSKLIHSENNLKSQSCLQSCNSQSIFITSILSVDIINIYVEYETWERYRIVLENIDSREGIIRIPADRNIYRRKVAMKLELESTISQLRNNCSNEHMIMRDRWVCLIIISVLSSVSPERH